ncbi:diacylglycerol O-acyltransferase 1 [Monosporozyma servazzii]
MLYDNSDPDMSAKYTHNNISNKYTDNDNTSVTYRGNSTSTTLNNNSSKIVIDNDVIKQIKGSKRTKLLSKKPVLDSCCSPYTPLQRRLQTLAIATHISTIPFFVILTFFILSFPIFWPFLIPYFIYYLLDRTPANGKIHKRYSPWFRSLSIWTYLCDYFPLKIHKTTDLKPTFPPDSTVPTGPRYIFGYHPHGIGALGAFGTFATDGAHWSKLCPGIPVSLLTIVTQFTAPLYRDYLMALGITSVSKKNALKVLENYQSICIVVGGVRESLLSSEDSVELILHNRKGFIKLALQTGNVSLVPVFGFGETNCFKVYETQEGSILHKIQFWFKQKLGFTFPIFFARGLFNYDFGLIPFRTPLNVVLGNPIYIKEKHDQPDQSLIEHYHSLYVKELENIYYSNRDKFGSSDIKLEIVD